MRYRFRLPREHSHVPLAFFQTAADGKFAHPRNAEAMEHLHKAAAALGERTKERIACGVEGTHEP